MFSTIPQMLMEKAATNPDAVLQYSKNENGDFIPVTYGEFIELTLNFSAGLLSLGAKPGDHIGLISDNRK